MEVESTVACRRVNTDSTVLGVEPSSGFTCTFLKDFSVRRSTVLLLPEDKGSDELCVVTKQRYVPNFVTVSVVTLVYVTANFGDRSTSLAKSTSSRSSTCRKYCCTESSDGKSKSRKSFKHCSFKKEHSEKNHPLGWKVVSPCKLQEATLQGKCQQQLLLKQKALLHSEVSNYSHHTDSEGVKSSLCE